MNNEMWGRQQQKFRQRMSQFGATPLLSLKNRDASVFLAHSNFDAYEGSYDKEPFLRLQLCTSHVGRIYRDSADGMRLDGIIRPGSYGLTLPHTEAEGFWPRLQALAILIKPGHLSQFGDGISLQQLEPISHKLHRDPLVSAVMTAMWRDAEVHGLTSAFFDHGLALILKRLSEYRLNGGGADVRPARPLSKAHLKKVQDLIESRLNCDIRTNELAIECGQDVRSFTRSFRASTGFAPYEYLTLRRMERAKQLLHSGTSITEVAFLVGYSNPSKFSAAFRRFYGCSPSIWRREQRS